MSLANRQQWDLLQQLINRLPADQFIDLNANPTANGNLYPTLPIKSLAKMLFEHKQFEIIQTILVKSSTEIRLKVAIAYAASNGPSSIELQKIIDLIGDWSVPMHNDYLLHNAASSGNLAEVQRLVSSGNYNVNDIHIDLHYPPLDLVTLNECEPIYETIPGWKSSTFGVTDFDELPEAARNYIRRLEELCAVPFSLISTGAERDQTIVLADPFVEEARPMKMAN